MLNIPDNGFAIRTGKEIPVRVFGRLATQIKVLANADFGTGAGCFHIALRIDGDVRTYGEIETKAMGAENGAGHFLSAPYFQGLENETNQKFVEKFLSSPYGKNGVTHYNMEETYTSAYVFKNALEKVIAEQLPENDHFFPEDQITDRSSRFLAAELVREKIMRQLGAELPYQITVEIEEFKQQGKTLHIHALILVERDGQKKIIMGDKGERIKRIGSDARRDMEVLFDSKVMLNLWVKVKGGWSDDERALRSLGYGDL